MRDVLRAERSGRGGELHEGNGAAFGRYNAVGDPADDQPGAAISLARDPSLAGPRTADGWGPGFYAERPGGFTPTKNIMPRREGGRGGRDRHACCCIAP